MTHLPLQSRLTSHPGIAEFSVGEALIARSLKRSLEQHRLDPGRRGLPRILTAAAVRETRDSMEPVLRVARGAMESLFLQVRDAGYVVLLTDAQGVTVDFITNPALDRELRRAGLYAGACWSEKVEGTCAVGVCAVDHQPITVHHEEHFRVINKSLTCSAAPIFDPKGGMLGVLDASALHSPDDKRSQHLVLQLVRSTARMVENAYFLRRFEHDWVLRIGTRPEFLEVSTDGLVALDGSGRILAANQRFLDDSGQLAVSLQGRDVEQALGIRFDELVSHARNGAHRPIGLHLPATGSRCFALLRAPRVNHPIVLSPVAPAHVAARAPARSGSEGALARVVGSDPRMLRNMQQALRVIDRDIPLLLQGESGTGKEVFARALHAASRRAQAPFIAVNCAAIPESLAESELFGYREGAFTGARPKGAPGWILQADRGTLFLDEIGDMPLAMQTRLLRVLSEHEVTPLGADRGVHVDCRVICATHHDLHELVRRGEFRLDLLHRLNGLVLELPALRERSDRSELLREILGEQARLLQLDVPVLEPDVEQRLLAYAWPGNLREMSNVLRTALALCEGGRMELAHLPVAAMDWKAPDARLDERAPSGHGGTELAGREALIGVLRRCGWNVTEAARLLAVSRSTVYRRMERHGIVEPNRRD